MKNLFRYLAHSFLYSLSQNKELAHKPQNNSSPIDSTTFFTQEGDLLQIEENNVKACTYGIIQIQFRKPYIHLTDAEDVLHRFLKGLQERFQIIYTTDAHYLNSIILNEHITTVYWQDAARKDWKVQGWTNGQALTVRYIKNINDVPVQQENLFFGGRTMVMA